jgi:hypothetical protein
MEGTSGSQILGQAFQIITFGADYGAAEMNIYVCVHVCACVCACACICVCVSVSEGRDVFVNP